MSKSYAKEILIFRIKDCVPWALKGLTLAAVLIGGFLVQRSFVMDVTYQWVDVRSVAHIPGGDMSERLVIVDIDDRDYPIRTADRLLSVYVGGNACVSKRKMFLRARARYQLALAGFCKSVVS